MQPQHVGACYSSCGRIDALASQGPRLSVEPYLMKGVSIMVQVGNTQVSLTSETGRARHLAVQCPLDRNRRPRCPRASNSLQRSALLPQSRHVPAARLTKNTLLFSQSQSRLSQSTQANTSKPVATDKTGQASAPASTPILLTARHAAFGSTLNIGGE
jgi:hypothetical protein